MVELLHTMPTDLMNSCDGLLYCLYSWAYDATSGLFPAGMLIAFGFVIFMASQRLGTTRAFGFSAFVVMTGSIWLATMQLMAWWLASLLILIGAAGFASMIISER